MEEGCLLSHIGVVILSFANCIIYNNTVYLVSSLVLYVSRSSSTTGFYFKNVSVHFNSVTVMLYIHQSSVMFVNIENIIYRYDQFEVGHTGKS